MSYDAHVIWKHTHTIKYCLSKLLNSGYTGFLDLHWLHKLLAQAVFPLAVISVFCIRSHLLCPHWGLPKSLQVFTQMPPSQWSVYVISAKHSRNDSFLLLKILQEIEIEWELAISLNETGLILFLKPENCNTLKENFRSTSCMKVDIKIP